MTAYIVARTLAAVPTLLFLILFVVLLIRLLPGDAADLLLAEAPGDSATRDQVEKRLGLDKSVPEEFVSYSYGIIKGDLGNSLWSGRSVTAIIMGSIGVTLELGLLSLIIGTILGITIGVISATKQGSVTDYTLRSFAVVGLSVPSFAIATMLIVLPVLWWGWSPPIIYRPWSDGFLAHFGQLIIPGVLGGITLGAVLMRLTRTTMLDVLRQDYIRTARAKGLNSRSVVMSHGFRNALIPVASLIGLQMAFLLSGNVLLESIFGLPGIGRQMILAIGQRDYPVIQGIALVSGLCVIIANLMVDISYGVLDPRVKAR